MKEKIMVLLVEDNPGDVRLIQENLKESDEYEINISVCHSLKNTFEYLEHNNIDVVILDLGLPDSRGLETLKKLRKKYSDIPIVILTANKDNDIWIKALETGADDYLLKNNFNTVNILKVLQYAIVRKKLKLEQQKREHHLKELAVMKNEFISMVSHEIKNPLNVLLGMLDLLIINKEKIIPEKRDDYILRCKKSTERMLRLIQDLSDITKLETNRFSIKKELTDVIELLKSNYEMLKIKAEENNIKLRYEFNGVDKLLINIDNYRIEQVILNLIKNALRFAETQVKLILEKTQKNILLKVEDDGQGIDEQDLNKLFDKFYRGRQNKSQDKGTGLGLAVVKGIVESHNGKVYAENRKDNNLIKGARFIVELPLS